MFTIDTHTHIIQSTCLIFKKIWLWRIYHTSPSEAGKAWMMQGKQKIREILKIAGTRVRIEEMQQHKADMQVICTIRSCLI